ncbi:MAG: ATP-dependent Clp protease adaptor protein ClpS [Pseudohongiellaceae bacterium]|jgi:ATP-dependent Clp protease adaptor protein ClpS
MRHLTQYNRSSFPKQIPFLDVLFMSMHNKHLLELKMTNLPTGPIGSREDEGEDDNTGFAATTEKPKLKRPPLYKVVLINDDYTPMDFVIDVLRSYFSMNAEKATHVMLKVHTEGKGVCGVFSKDVAETKAAQVNDYSKECEQPLLCSVEIDG